MLRPKPDQNIRHWSQEPYEKEKVRGRAPFNLTTPASVFPETRTGRRSCSSLVIFGPPKTVGLGAVATPATSPAAEFPFLLRRTAEAQPGANRGFPWPVLGRVPARWLETVAMLLPRAEGSVCWNFGARVAWGPVVDERASRIGKATASSVGLGHLEGGSHLPTASITAHRQHLPWLSSVWLLPVSGLFGRWMNPTVPAPRNTSLRWGPATVGTPSVCSPL
jgi:hypothetical protein